MKNINDLIKKLCPDSVEFSEIDSLCKTVSAKIKVKSLDYMKSGKYPIIDQSQNFISGYTNENSPFPTDEYVVFGDHTCIVKYVDFPFVQGADGVKVLSADKNIIMPRYLFYCMSNIRMNIDYSRHWSKIKKELIPVPPVEIQREITEILSTQDKLVELKQKLIDNKKQQKKWLMQNLLTGKIRLKGFEEKWKKVKLGDYIVEYTEKTTVNNQYPILTSSRKGLFLQSDYYKKQIASENNIGYNIVPYGYFTYRHMSDDEIFKFNINTIVENGIVSTLYPVFTTKNLIDKWLLYTLNYGSEFPKYARMQKQGGSRTYMYLEKLKKIKLSFPSVMEQTAIAEILSVQDREIQLLEKELEQEKLKKKFLMNLLLSGK